MPKKPTKKKCKICQESNGKHISFCPCKPKEVQAFQMEYMILDSKPPLGIAPKYIHEEHRMSEICEGILRYIEAGKEVPEEWIQELLDIRKTRKK